MGDKSITSGALRVRVDDDDSVFFCFLFFLSSGGWVKIKLKLPHFHVSDTCRVARSSAAETGDTAQSTENPKSGNPLLVCDFPDLKPVEYGLELLVGRLISAVWTLV